MSQMGKLRLTGKGLLWISCNVLPLRAKTASRLETQLKPLEAGLWAMESLSGDSEGHQNVASELALGCRLRVILLWF